MFGSDEVQLIPWKVRATSCACLTCDWKAMLVAVEKVLDRDQPEKIASEWDVMP